MRRRRKTEFGKPLVNSCFTFSLLVGVSVHDTTLGTLVANLGYDKVVFPKPGVRRRHAALRKRMHRASRKQVAAERRHRHLGAPRASTSAASWCARCTRTALILKKAAMTEPRSWLFVPADSERKIAKALDSDADAIIFDLEDSVAPAQKARRARHPQGPAEALRRPAMVGARQSARQRVPQGRPEAHRHRRHPRHRPSQGRERRRRHRARAPHRQHPDPRDRHRDRGEPVRPAVLPRPQVAARGDELGRGGPVGGARRLVQI